MRLLALPAGGMDLRLDPVAYEMEETLVEYQEEVQKNSLLSEQEVNP